MKQSSYFLYTLREYPNDAEIISHKLMLKSGMINKVSSGIYTYLPIGNRVIQKIESIVREEMNAAGAHELTMPVVQPSNLWKRSGRLDHYGKELLRIKDRKSNDYVLGPTHEEIITDIADRFLKSYKRLPQTLYQIQTKFRDEIRPRFGLMRAREFIMKDAYSFDMDGNGMLKSYLLMRDAYIRIFNRIGFRYRIVKADSGTIGGNMSEEFMVLSETGEDRIILCDSCDYAANVDAAQSRFTIKDESEKPIEIVDTPDCKTILSVCEFLKTDPAESVKTIMVEADGEPIMLLVAGSDTVNEVKLKHILGSYNVESAGESTLRKFLLPAGFMGPVNAPKIRIIADDKIKQMKNMVCGANKKDKHFLNVNYERDFSVDEFADIRDVKIGDSCPECGGRLAETRGIEVGHIFQLKDKYSKNMNAAFLDKNGKRQHFLMGCYGIGVGRIAAAAIEQSHDNYGIIWQSSIAPFKAGLLSLGKSEDVTSLADKIYDILEEAGIELLYNDKDERAGVKLADSDLIGLPVVVIVGEKGIKNHYIEVKIRKTGEKKQFRLDRIDLLAKWIKEFE